MSGERLIPASQHHSGLATTLRNVSDLTPDQKLMCDGLIIKLGEALGAPAAPTPESRAGLWDLVFEDGWDTNCPITHPGAIRPRRGVESMTQVGTWKVSLPAPTTPSKRRRSGEPVTNPHRQAGAPAFIKPNLNWDDFGVSFTVCDKVNSCANAKYVAWNDGWTLQQARAEAMMHWDRHEIERVTEYNFKLVVCWARGRLLAELYAGNPAGATNGASNRPAGRALVTENTDELVQLVTCADKMKEMAILVDEARRIAEARPVRRRSLADRAPSI
ncbi:hypothetical protein QBC43DRAFT_361741 [Cladorrhinum sp. PSN259]|nr:hypothetical protein QBC43DRAFT_361741 [Cladorrhinum sp. PSN259]